MIEYKYDRINIPNPAKLDADQQPNVIILAQEIEAELPNKKFKLFCDPSYLVLKFEEELTAEEKTNMETTITTYKNYSGV